MKGDEKQFWIKVVFLRMTVPMHFYWRSVSKRKKPISHKKYFFFFWWTESYLCIQFPAGSIFHPHTRTQCLPDTKAHWPLCGHTGNQAVFQYELHLVSGVHWLFDRILQMSWVPLYSLLHIISSRSWKALFRPNMSWKHLKKFFWPAYCVENF